MRWFVSLFILLLAGAIAASSLNTKPATPTPGPVAIAIEPLVLNPDDPAQLTLGALRYLGGWELTSGRTLFGGLSALAVKPDGHIWAVSDGGVVFELPQPGPAAKVIVQARLLPIKRPKKHWMPRPEDSESIAADADFTHVWVGYELLQLVCRYETSLTVIGPCRRPRQVSGWPDTESLETLARLPDGRFIAISEGGSGPAGGRDMLVFAGDPVSLTTRRPLRMSYMPPTGYNPTDAVYIGDGKLIVLNRRATLYDGFTAVLKLVDLAGMRNGAVLGGREIARFAPPVLADNFEGLALERHGSQRILWMVSDDNHLFFQRTLLLKFALDEDL